MNEKAIRTVSDNATALNATSLAQLRRRPNVFLSVALQLVQCPLSQSMEAVQLISFNTAFVHQMHACTKPRPCGLLIPVCVDVQSALYSRDARVQPVPFLVTVSITALTLALGLAAGAV